VALDDERYGYAENPADRGHHRPRTAGAHRRRGRPPTEHAGVDQGAPTYYDSGIARTPYMGWNSYFAVGAASEEKVLNRNDQSVTLRPVQSLMAGVRTRRTPAVRFGFSQVGTRAA
jgi:hypothetical protein